MYLNCHSSQFLKTIKYIKTQLKLLIRDLEIKKSM